MLQQIRHNAESVFIPRLLAVERTTSLHSDRRWPPAPQYSY